MSSELKTNKVSPATGTALQIGDSGDTVDIPSGATFDVTGATVTGLSAGKVLQVVSAVKTNTSSYGGTTFSTTGLEVTITPSATSSKIFIIATPSIGAHMDNTSGCCFLRDSTELNLADAASARPLFASNNQYQYNSYNTESHPMTFLDSPSSTSAITYKVAYKMSSIVNTTYPYIYMNRGIYDTDNIHYGRSSSTITVMEIEG